MISEIEATARRLALQPGLTDYHYWRMLKDLGYVLHTLERRKMPIPFELVQVRATVKRAREKLERYSRF